MMGKRMLFIRHYAGRTGEYVGGIYDLDAPKPIALLGRFVERAPALRHQLAAAIPLIQRGARRTTDVLREVIISA